MHPLPPSRTDRQTENTTSLRTSYAGGNYSDNLIPGFRILVVGQNRTYLFIEVEETLGTVNVVEWCETRDFPVYVLWVDPESTT